MTTALRSLERLLGSWKTEATHPAMPGVVVHGTAEVEWLEGQRFLIQRTRNDHPDFPDAISIIGHSDRDRVGAASAATEPRELTMHYFDSRGVSRVYEASASADAWHLVRMAPGFSQRFTGQFQDGGNTIAGLWQTLDENEKTWKDDLQITFRKR
ncbi:MAG TPA: hypothetical protein VFN67_23245 [Polyangiales bacterium]|nr:hypothetical protein [Polyangiales bacterium]